mgnify:CR=1 FL=1
MTDENIRVLKVAPGKAPEAVAIPNTLEAMQQMVGGYIEVIPLEEICLVRNERGKLMGLPGGRRLGNDVIAGTFFLAGDSPASGFCSLTPEQIDLWGRYFAQPEVFQPDEVERSIRIEFYTM